MKILIVANYILSHQQSMQRFGGVLTESLLAEGHGVKMIRSKAILCLYLTHQIIGYIFINYLYTHGVSSPEILLVTVLFFAIGLASLLHCFVEKPSQSWIRNYWHNSHKFKKINDSNPAKHGFIH